MLAAIFVILVTTFLSYYDKRKRWNRGLIIAFIIITVFAALRYGYGSDYMEYLKNFQKLQYTDINDDLTYIRTEPGWNYLSIICQPIGFFGMIMIIAAIEYAIICRFIIKYVPTRYRWLALLCFTLNANLFLLGLTMIRQFIAMCIILLASDFIINKSWIKSIILVITASFFHVSALIFLPICFVGFVDVRKWGGGVLAFCGVILVLLYFTGANLFEGLAYDLMQLEQFSEYGSEYILKEESPSLWSLPRLYELLLLFSLLYFIKEYNKEQAVMALLFSIGYVFNGFITLSSMAARLTLYFSMFGIVCIPLIVQHIKKNVISTVFLSFYLCYLIYRFIAFFNSPTWVSFREYHTIFETKWQ